MSQRGSPQPPGKLKPQLRSSAVPGVLLSRARASEFPGRPGIGRAGASRRPRRPPCSPRRHLRPLESARSRAAPRETSPAVRRPDRSPEAGSFSVRSTRFGLSSVVPGGGLGPGSLPLYPRAASRCCRARTGHSSSITRWSLASTSRSICRTRSRVRPTILPISLSVIGSVEPSRP